MAAKNPYGGKPGGGVTLSPYFKPTPYIGSRNDCWEMQTFRLMPTWGLPLSTSEG